MTESPAAESSATLRWMSAFAPTSMPRVGSSRMSSSGAVANQRARSTFCWLPPDRVLTTESGFAGYPKDNSVLIDVNVDRNARAIYYWVKEKDGPRAYVVPYHEDQSNKASEAKAKATQTQGQMVFHSKSKEKGEERNGEHAQGSGNGGGGAGKGVGRGGGAPTSQKGGLGGGESQTSYGAAAAFGGEEPVEINIDVVPSLPAKN